jgi:hypothetical protein
MVSADAATAAPFTPTTAFIPTIDAATDAATAERATLQVALASGPPNVLSAASTPEPAIAVVATELALPPAPVELEIALGGAAEDVALADTAAAPSAARPIDIDPLAGAALIATPSSWSQPIAPSTAEPITAPPAESFAPASPADPIAPQPIAEPIAPHAVAEAVHDTPAPVEPTATAEIASEGKSQSIAASEEPVAPPIAVAQPAECFTASTGAAPVAAMVTPLHAPAMAAARPTASTAQGDPLADIAALSEDEKIALFS